MRPELLDLVPLHDKGGLAGRGSDNAGRTVGGDVLKPPSLLVRDLVRRAVGSDAQQPAVVTAAYKAIARRVADQRQHRAAMQRLGCRRLGGVYVSGQQAHATVAQGVGRDRSVPVEGAGGDGRIGCDGTARWQGLPPGRV